jgi:hypothetical protein
VWRKAQDCRTLDVNLGRLWILPKPTERFLIYKARKLEGMCEDIISLLLGFVISTTVSTSVLINTEDAQLPLALKYISAQYYSSET